MPLEIKASHCLDQDLCRLFVAHDLFELFVAVAHALHMSGDCFMLCDGSEAIHDALCSFGFSCDLRLESRYLTLIALCHGVPHSNHRLGHVVPADLAPHENRLITWNWQGVSSGDRSALPWVLNDAEQPNGMDAFNTLS
jgi:hypothetical protein